MNSRHTFLASMMGAVVLGATVSAQTPTMLHGQKVLVDKYGQVVQPSPLVNPLPQAPLVGGADSCVTPDAITGSGPFAFDTTTASTGTEGQNEAICLNVGQIGLNRDVWFTWTAGFTGMANLSLCGMATFDTKVAVYDGATCPTTAALACNDDFCGLQSEIHFSVTSGNSYAIQVGQYGTGTPAPGNFTINVFIPPVPPINDDCATPTVLPGPGTYAYDTTLATTGTQGQSTAACGPGLPFYKDVWFTYPATSNGSATVTTCGFLTSTGSLDTKIQVFDGAGCPVNPAIACNDDATCATQSGLTSTLTWSTTCGSTYTIQVGQYAAAPNIAGSINITESGTQCGPTGVPYCFGDGTGTACPCGNSGAAGNGCASSVNANGANLTTTGSANLANDTLVLQGTGMANSSCLYFQGTSQISAAFGDGLRCAGGTVIRLGTKTNVGGASQYPTAGNPSISVKGAVTTPGTRTYQTWYRNAAAFCTPSTFNLTNGILITWL